MMDFHHIMMLIHHKLYDSYKLYYCLSNFYCSITNLLIPQSWASHQALKRKMEKLVNICQNCIDWLIIIHSLWLPSKVLFKTKEFESFLYLSPEPLLFISSLFRDIIQNRRQLFTEGEKYLWASSCQGQTPLIIEMLKWKYDIDKYRVVLSTGPSILRNFNSGWDEIFTISRDFSGRD